MADLMALPQFGPRLTHLTAVDRFYAALARPVCGLVWTAAYARGASRDELRCRAGHLPPAGVPLWWFHGASAGELGAALRLVALLRHEGYRFTAAYTAANRAGVELAASTGDADTVAVLAPWDHPRWVARAFDRWQPRALFLVETELWPGLITEAWRRGVPAVCVSARMYLRDVARYRLVRAVTAPMLRRLTGILAQNETEQARFLALGAPPDRCMVAGNLKYLATENSDGAGDRRVATPDLRKELGLKTKERIVVFGSVHADEIRLLCAALDQLPAEGHRTIIAPRHASAVATIAAESGRRGWKTHQRSAGAPPADWQVLVLDQMGELARAYAIASVAVVGGGFGRHGGHNPIEPVMVNTPAIFGPHFHHFEEEALALTAAVPEACVRNAAELGRCLREWLADEARRERVLALQRRVVPDGTAIARRYLRALSPWLERGGT